RSGGVGRGRPPPGAGGEAVAGGEAAIEAAFGQAGRPGPVPGAARGRGPGADWHAGGAAGARGHGQGNTRKPADRRGEGCPGTSGEEEDSSMRLLWNAGPGAGLVWGSTLCLVRKLLLHRAPVRHTSVDVTAADWRKCVARGGGPD